MAFANRAFILSGFLTLVACPPPADLASGPTQGPGGNGGEFVGEPGPEAGEVAPKVDLTALEAAFTQEAITAKEHVTISGVLDGGCDGYVRVQAIEDAEREDSQGNGLVTFSDVDGAAFGGTNTADWALAVPKDMPLIVNALCDGNRDGIVDLATEGGSPLEHFEALSEDVGDVVLMIADLVAGISDQGVTANDPGAEPPDGWVPPPPSDGSVPPPPQPGEAIAQPDGPAVPEGPPPEGIVPAPEGPAPAPAPEAAATEAPAAEAPAAEAPAGGERL